MLAITKKIRGSKSRNFIVGTNILCSMIFKLIGILCSLVVVPLTLNYLNNEEYGIWLTLSTILIWFSFSDVGLGNGLRNYLTQAISEDNLELGRTYISTTLALLLIIVTIFFGCLVFLAPLLNWSQVFNTQSIPPSALLNIVTVAVSFTLINFIVKNVGVIYIAFQKYAMNDFLNLFGNVVALFVIFILTKCTNSSLMNVTLVFTASPVIIFTLFAIPLFLRHPQLRPRIKSVDFSLTRKLMGKGLGFFFIQISSCLVIFGSANVFIAKICGPDQVTIYNIAYKYFNVLVLGYTIIISPLWNAYTDAYVKGDYNWITKTFKRSLLIWLLSLVGGAIMLVLSQWFYHLWVGEKVTIPQEVSFSILIFISLYNLNNCATYLLNGLNMIRVQLYTSCAVTVLYLLFVHKAGLLYQIVGISICMGASYLIQSIIHLYQCRLILSGKATGVWIK